MDANRYAPKRYLQPGCFEDVFLMYQGMTGSADQVSRTTLLTVWNERWKRYLLFRSEGQGKRCKQWAKLDQMRLEAGGVEERAAVITAKQEHIKDIMLDRDVSIRGNRLAEKHAASPNSDGFDQIVKITIDGVDQAKFRVPTNLASSVEFEACFRPQLHVVGVIIHGHLECYFIMNSD